MPTPKYSALGFLFIGYSEWDKHVPASVTTLNTIINNLRVEVTELDRKLKIKEDEIKKLNKGEGSRAKVETLKLEIQALNNNLVGTLQSLKDIQQESRDKSREIADLQEKIIKLNKSGKGGDTTTEAELREQIVKSLKARDDLYDKVHETEIQINQERLKIATLEHQFEIVKSERDTNRILLDKHMDDMANVLKEKHDLAEANIDLNQKLAREEEAKNNANQEINHLKKNIDEYLKTIERLEREYESSRDEIKKPPIITASGLEEYIERFKILIDNYNDYGIGEINTDWNHFWTSIHRELSFYSDEEVTEKLTTLMLDLETARDTEIVADKKERISKVVKNIEKVLINTRQIIPTPTNLDDYLKRLKELADNYIQFGFDKNFDPWSDSWDRIKNEIDAFGSGNLAKEQLNILIDEIAVDDKVVDAIHRRYTTIKNALQKLVIDLKGEINWSDISSEFIDPNLVKQWTNYGFDYGTTRKWILKGITAKEADLVNWIINTKYKIVEEDLNLTDLRNEFAGTGSADKKKWFNLSNAFKNNEVLISEWEKLGFDFDKAKEYIEFGLRADEALFAYYLETEKFELDEFGKAQLETQRMFFKNSDSKIFFQVQSITLPSSGLPQTWIGIKLIPNTFKFQKLLLSPTNEPQEINLVRLDTEPLDKYLQLKDKFEVDKKYSLRIKEGIDNAIQERTDESKTILQIILDAFEVADIKELKEDDGRTMIYFGASDKDYAEFNPLTKKNILSFVPFQLLNSTWTVSGKGNTKYLEITSGTLGTVDKSGKEIKPQINFVSAEHLFQTLKFVREPIAECNDIIKAILNETEPSNLNALTNSQIGLVRGDWNDDTEYYKVRAMAFAITGYIQSDISVSNKLEATGDKVLVFDTANNTWPEASLWGNDKNDDNEYGDNWLGTIYMANRTYFRIWKLYENYSTLSTEIKKKIKEHCGGNIRKYVIQRVVDITQNYYEEEEKIGNPISTALKEFYEKTKAEFENIVNSDWSNIHSAFTGDTGIILRQNWVNKGFDYEATKKWIEAGFNPNETELVNWLVKIKADKDNNYKNPQWIKDNIVDLETLRTEKAQYDIEIQKGKLEFVANKISFEDEGNTLNERRIVFKFKKGKIDLEFDKRWKDDFDSKMDKDSLLIYFNGEEDDNLTAFNDLKGKLIGRENKDTKLTFQINKADLVNFNSIKNEIHFSTYDCYEAIEIEEADKENETELENQKKELKDKIEKELNNWTTYDFDAEEEYNKSGRVIGHWGGAEKPYNTWREYFDAITNDRDSDIDHSIRFIKSDLLFAMVDFMFPILVQKQIKGEIKKIQLKQFINRYSDQWNIYKNNIKSDIYDLVKDIEKYKDRVNDESTVDWIYNLLEDK